MFVYLPNRFHPNSSVHPYCIALCTFRVGHSMWSVNMSKNKNKHSLVNVPPLYFSMLVVWWATKSRWTQRFCFRPLSTLSLLRYIYCFLSLQSYTRNVCTIVHPCLNIQHFKFGTYPVPLNSTKIIIYNWNKKILN